MDAFDQLRQSFDNLSQIDEKIKSLKEEFIKLKNECALPIGAIQAFALSEVPEGWLFCDGSELLIENYPELFNAIHNMFGGDGTISFNLPDLQGVFIRGWDKLGNTDPERQLGSLQEDAIQGHSHKLTVSDDKTGKAGEHKHAIRSEWHEASGWGSMSVTYTYAEYSTGNDRSTNSAGEHTHKLPKLEIGSATSDKHGSIRCDVETRPKNIAVLYCIKAK